MRRDMPTVTMQTCRRSRVLGLLPLIFQASLLVPGATAAGQSQPGPTKIGLEQAIAIALAHNHAGKVKYESR